jgi:hypothetical protein
MGAKLGAESLKRPRIWAIKADYAQPLSLGVVRLASYRRSWLAARGG